MAVLETNNDSKLITIIKRKGISFERGDLKIFKNYDYYQVINGYKNLFIVGVETIDDIYNNLMQGVSINDYIDAFGLDKSLSNVNLIFDKICQKICSKYGLKFSKSWNANRMISEIKKIDYVHHKYASSAKFSDFVRMYKFEHELRLLLLRYTLIIEENMKNIFIKFLNNSKASANFLTDINNYNLKDGDSMALETLKKVIDEHGNKHSKPIKRKRDQNLTIPYWILINELSMNQTYKAIDNLNIHTSRLIFQNCVNHFTNLNLDYTDKRKRFIQRKKEKEQIKKFKILLSYLGEFRNMLAHNQPIYSFNIANTNMLDFPTLYYSRPKVQNPQNRLAEQHNMNAALMYDFQDFFGTDIYNRQNHNININLGTIIYIIYKIISHIDHNTNFYDELISIYSKYNILFSNHANSINSYDNLVSLKNKIRDFPDFEFEELIQKIDNDEKHKMDVKKMKKMINDYRKDLMSLNKKVLIEKKMSKYSLFASNAQYTKYTGIDTSYFNKIK